MTDINPTDDFLSAYRRDFFEGSVHSPEHYHDQFPSVTLEASRRVLGEDHPGTLNSRYWLGVCLVNLKLFPRAETALLAAYESYLRVFGETHPGTAASINWLIKLYEGWNKPEEAAKWKAKLPKKEQKLPEKKQ